MSDYDHEPRCDFAWHESEVGRLREFQAIATEAWRKERDQLREENARLLAEAKDNKRLTDKRDEVQELLIAELRAKMKRVEEIANRYHMAGAGILAVIREGGK